MRLVLTPGRSYIPCGLPVGVAIAGRFREPFSGPLIGGGPRFFTLPAVGGAAAAAAAAADDDDEVGDAAAKADADVEQLAGPQKGGPIFFPLVAAAVFDDNDGSAGAAVVDDADADADAAAAAFVRALSDKISCASRVAVVRHHFFVAQKTSTDMSLAKASFSSTKSNRGVGKFGSGRLYYSYIYMHARSARK